MDKFYLEGTRKTPKISLDPNGILRIEGRSIPEDARSFYNEVIDWVEEYLVSPPKATIIDIAFEYLNSGTSKSMLEILTLLKGLLQNGNILTINWYFEEGDDDIQERGEYFASILGVKINFIETE
jgi:hypothetical protein